MGKLGYPSHSFFCLSGNCKRIDLISSGWADTQWSRNSLNKQMKKVSSLFLFNFSITQTTNKERVFEISTLNSNPLVSWKNRTHLISALCLREKQTLAHSVTKTKEIQHKKNQLIKTHQRLSRPLEKRSACTSPWPCGFVWLKSHQNSKPPESSW